MQNLKDLLTFGKQVFFMLQRNRTKHIVLCLFTSYPQFTTSKEGGKPLNNLLCYKTSNKPCVINFTESHGK